MDRYVIVTLLSGEALKFHEHTVESVCYKFKVQKQKLPGHITLKAPFETDRINEIQDLLSNFCETKAKAPIKIEGFNHFRNNVVFMDVKASNEATVLHENLYDSLKTLDWLEWKPNEKRNRVFHCTIVSRRISDKFNDIWNYVNKLHCNFNTSLDNITIMKWGNGMWNVYKQFDLH